METPAAGAKVIATCPLGTSGKEEKIWLTEEYLQLLYRGQLRVFALAEVRQLAFNHRKLLLPLVTGGIAATLSLVAIFKLFYNPWLVLSILAAGCLATFIGYRGSWVLTVQEERVYSDFFIPAITPALEAFIKYANTFTANQPKGILYLPLTTEQAQALWQQEHFTAPADLRLYYRQELAQLPTQYKFFLPVDSLSPTVQLNWKPEEQSDQMVPQLQKGSRLQLQEYPPIARKA